MKQAVLSSQFSVLSEEDNGLNDLWGEKFFAPLPTNRGRNESHLSPPAQFRTSGIPASGS